jgi:alpha-L-fucosidase 2
VTPHRFHLTFAGILCALIAPLPAFEFVPDVEYARAGDQPLHLDAGVPEGDGPFPVVILVHGGGWSSGDRRGDITILTNALNAARFTWFSVDYRLAPAHRWPACHEDVLAAIRWVKTNAHRFKGDANRIALAGYSAGGHLAVHAAVLADDATRVQAVAALAAPVDHVADSERRGGLSQSLQKLLARPPELDPATRALLRDLSPVNFIRPGLPPFVLVHGTADNSVPYAQSLQLRDRLRAARVPVEQITLTNAPHRITEWRLYQADWAEQLVAMLARALAQPATISHD